VSSHEGVLHTVPRNALISNDRKVSVILGINSNSPTILTEGPCLRGQRMPSHDAPYG
jgi:hypothetical protein